MSGRWRPVTDDEPRELENVILWRPGEPPTVGFRVDHLWMWNGEDSFIGERGWQPTHWLPLSVLPPLPAEGER